MKSPFVFRGPDSPEADPPPAPSSRGLETPLTRHSNCVLGAPGTPASTPLFVSVPPFFTNNCVHHVAAGSHPQTLPGGWP